MAKNIDKEQLYTEYIINNKTQVELAAIFNVSRATIQNYLKKYNITKPTKKEIFKNEVISMYTNGHTYYNIHKKLNCSLSTIYSILEDEGLKPDTKDYSDISKEMLEKFYVSENRTLQEISIITKKSLSELSNYLTFYGIKKQTIQEKLNNNLEYIKEEYISKNRTLLSIAKELDINVNTLQSILYRNNIVKFKKSSIDFDKLRFLCNQNTTIQEIADALGYSRTHTGQVISKFSIQRKANLKETSIERSIKEILDNNNIEYIQNDRKQLDGKEIDFFIPRLNIGIEVNGLYWHSTLINNNKYHIYEKYLLAKKKGITLLNIFEDEILNKADIVKSRLLSKLNSQTNNIYARKCTVESIESNIGIEFLQKYHIQGAGTNNIYLGLKYNNELVSVMSFSKPNIAKGKAKVTYELNRFASSINIVGGASKLFNYFIKKYDPNNIVSYSDIRWNTGNLYTVLGFSFVKNSSPNYWYIQNNKRIHRYSFRKSVLINKFNIKNTKLTEEEIAESVGLYRIYDCGSSVYIWNRKEKI